MEKQYPQIHFAGQIKMHDVVYKLCYSNFGEAALQHDKNQ